MADTPSRDELRRRLRERRRQTGRAAAAPPRANQMDLASTLLQCDVDNAQLLQLAQQHSNNPRAMYDMVRQVASTLEQTRFNPDDAAAAQHDDASDDDEALPPVHPPRSVASAPSPLADEEEEEALPPSMR